MAQVAFSHQFSHRWINAPQAVKEALIQEFEDIMQLLEEDTDLETFEFTVPDLHAHIDAINAEVARLEAERLEAERIEAERLELEKMEAERLLLEQKAAEQQRIFDTEEANHLASLDEQDQAVPYPQGVENLEDTEVIGVEEDSNEATLSDHVTPTTESQEPGVSNEQPTENPITELDAVINAPAPFTFDSSRSNAELDEDFVKELESRIDDYLSEQLANMSEDLKSWLREQVANRLNSK
ncbi:hypothetical protein [Psychrobacter sanguinis]|uniref:hypothetical protein n=1 Tax=Psychrobacter sanguinis TaxID=861445 RepID=UPI001919BA8F|nr:hypothetical protein [Psychrobacter sanguinis]MCC3345937.1 hypothetical protein [Psychrobacter sanguinis]